MPQGLGFRVKSLVWYQCLRSRAFQRDEHSQALLYITTLVHYGHGTVVPTVSLALEEAAGFMVRMLVIMRTIAWAVIAQALAHSSCRRGLRPAQPCQAEGLAVPCRSLQSSASCKVLQLCGSVHWHALELTSSLSGLQCAAGAYLLGRPHTNVSWPKGG